jgi:hypothetical protein
MIMRLLLSIFILCLMVPVIGCSTVSVDYVHDPEVDLTAMKSYDWLPVPSKSIRYPLILKQIKNEMNRQLNLRGLQPVSGDPDFLIALHGGIQSILAYEDWEYLQDNYEQYAIKRRIDLTTYTEDTLIVDFIDTSTGDLIYRATATVYLSLETTPERRNKRINEAVTKMLDGFSQLPVTASSN